MIRVLIAILVLSLTALTALSAQAPTAAPVLTEVQRLTVTNKLLVFQLAQVQLDKARSEVETLLRELQQPGYDFDLQTLTYTVKKPEKP